MRVTPVTDDPAAGGLSREITDYEYNDVGLPTETSGASGYLLATSYSALGQAEQLTLGTSAAAGTKKAYIINRFDEGTDRLINSHVTDDIHGYMPRDLTYAYDDVGNLTAIKGPATLGGPGKADYQCFVYDGYRRLTARTVPSRCAFHAAGGRQCLDSRSRVVDLALRGAEVQPHGIQVRITVKNTMTVSSLGHMATGYEKPSERFLQQWFDNDGIIGFGGRQAP